MTHRLFVEAAHVLLPDGLAANRTIVVEDGRIAGIAAPGDIAGADGERLGGPDALVVPGFVNAHQHGNPHGWAALGCPDSPLEPWMVDIRRVSRVEPEPAARVVGARQLRAGTTTTVHHQTTYAPTAEAYDAEVRGWLDGYRDAGVRVIFAAELKDRGEPVHFEERFFASLPAALAQRARALRVNIPPAEQLIEVLRGIRSDIRSGRYGAAELMLGPAGPVWCSDDLFSLVAKVAEQDDLGITSHILESPYEKTFGPRAYAGRETIPALDALGVVSERLLISHGCQLTRRDAELLAGRGASVVSNPGSNLRLHNGVAPVAMLLDAGVNVAIGTDSMALGDQDEILGELRLMQALQRPRGPLSTWLTTGTLLRILTENGAAALGRADIGAIKVGASADLVIADLRRITAPGAPFDPLSSLVGCAQPSDFAAVVSQGQVVARDGLLATPPPDVVRVPAPASLNELIDELMPYARDYYAGFPLPA
jgi:cytosine/adenosine deaminase-related metal-dependent hydrolase